MPKQGKRPQWVGVKERREFKHVGEEAEESDRYGDRADVVTIRTIIKHHKHERMEYRRHAGRWRGE